MAHALIVKRRGHTENFDEKKLYASVYAAALITHYNEHASEELANEITQKTKLWLEGKKDVTSESLKHYIHRLLAEQDKEVAFMYISHLDVC